MSAIVKKALVDARARLILFREMSRCAKELGTMTLKPQEVWEVEDQITVDQIDQAIAHVEGRKKPSFEVLT